MQNVYTSDFMFPAENIAGKIIFEIASVEDVSQ